jgi:hypothetical protein
MPALSASEKEAKAKKKKLEEDKALAARAEARKYLDTNHCGPRKTTAEQKYVGTVAARMAGHSRDNTIDVVLARRAKKQKVENEAKQKLVDQQNSFNKHIKPLPVGWKAVKDPSSDDTYYWNETTNETSWTRPLVHVQEAQQLTPELTARLQKKGVLGGDAAAASSGGEKKPAPGTLPPGWQAVQCPASKDYYYWHQATGCTTWTKPDASTASATKKGTAPSKGLGRGRGMVEPAWVAKRKREM